MSVQRFRLNSSELDSTEFGLDGFSPAFNLDSAALDGTGKLDGADFLTIASATAALGACIVSATSQTINPVSASAQLGQINSQASTLISHDAVGVGSFGSAIAQATATTSNTDTATALLGGVQAEAVVLVTHDQSAETSLQGIDAQATAVINNETTAIATLGALSAQATSETQASNTASALLGSLLAQAQATVTPVNKPVSSGGRIFLHPAPRPIINPIKPKPVLQPEVVIESKPKPKPKKFATIKATASVTVPSASIYALGSISWVAELDDLEVLELL